MQWFDHFFSDKWNKAMKKATQVSHYWISTDKWTINERCFILYCSCRKQNLGIQPFTPVHNRRTIEKWTQTMMMMKRWDDAFVGIETINLNDMAQEIRLFRFSPLKRIVCGMSILILILCVARQLRSGWWPVLCGGELWRLSKSASKFYRTMKSHFSTQFLRNFFVLFSIATHFAKLQ